VLHSNFLKILWMAAGKGGIVSGRPWQSMMGSAGKLVCSEAMMTSIWTHCRDLRHGLQRKEALVSNTRERNTGIGTITISGPLDLWLCSDYLPLCRYRHTSPDYPFFNTISHWPPTGFETPWHQTPSSFLASRYACHLPLAFRTLVSF
jgi:hypothetical protein